MFELLDDIRSQPWKPVLTWHVVATSIGFGGAAYLLNSNGYLPLVDGANLLFHEAGHPIFGILGSTLELYGGTLGQLVFPIATGVSFWARRETVGCAVAWIWFFENFLNIARYMADARAKVLPLVGGGEHDWANIFGRWGVLSYDTAIGGFVAGVGWFGMMAVWGWLIRRWYNPDHEET